jgi:hypothetical protein
MAHVDSSADRALAGIEWREASPKASGGLYPKRCQSIEYRRAFMLDRMLLIETEAGEALEQQGNGDLRLGAGERRSQAEMCTAAEGKMAGVGPLDIEAVRLGVPRRVMAGPREARRSYLAHLYLFAPDLERVLRYPAGLRHGRVVTQHFFHRMGDELGMGAEFDELIRIGEQRQNAVADQVGGGEVAGHQQQVAGNNDLPLGQPIPRLLGGHERADKVSAAPVASLLDRMYEIIIETLPRCRQLCRLLRCAGRIEDLRARV